MTDMFLRKRSSGVWQIVTHDGDTRVDISTGTTDRAEAEVFLARVKNGLTLEQLTKRYLEYSRTNHKPSTTLRADYALRDLKRILGPGVAVSDISPSSIEKFKMARLADKVQPTTVNSDLRHIKMFFSWLERIENRIPFNPVKRVKMFSIPQTQTPVFSIETFERLMVVLVPWARPFVQFAFATGMRRGELISLRWIDIDRERRIAYIRNQVSFKTKTNRERAVPLNDLALAALPGTTGDLVFTRGGEPIDERRIEEVFKWAVTAAGLHPKLHLHSLRHSFCTILLENGASITDVATIAGHSTIAVTERYAHLKGETMHHATDLLTKPHPSIG